MAQTLRTLLTTTIALLVALSLAACETVSDVTDSVESSVESGWSGLTGDSEPDEVAPLEDPDFIFPAFAVTEPDQMPDEIKIVAASFAHRLAGVPAADVEAKLPINQSALVVPREDVPLANFEVTELQVLEVSVPDDDPNRRSLVFILQFADAFGRGASTEALVDYQVEGDRIALQSVAWLPVSPPLPVFDSFLIPLPANGEIGAEAEDYTSFYNAVAEVAIPRSESANQLAAGGDFVLVVFGKTRAAPGSKLDLEISVGPEGKTLNKPEDARGLMFPGNYPVIVLPASLQAPVDDPLWVRLLYTHGIGATGEPAELPLLVDTFSLGNAPAGS